MIVTVLVFMYKQEIILDLSFVKKCYLIIVSTLLYITSKVTYHYHNLSTISNQYLRQIFPLFFS